MAEKRMSKAELLKETKALQAYVKHAMPGALLGACEDGSSVTQNDPFLPTLESVDVNRLDEEDGDNLLPAQRLAISAIASGLTFSAAARSAGVARKTLYLWRQESWFQEALDTLSREAFDAAATRIRNLMLNATRILGESLAEDDDPEFALRILSSERLWKVTQSGRNGPQDV